MRTRVLLGALAFLVACAFVAPAGAMNIGGTDYVLYGKTAVKMEDGPVVINGNVAVNDAGGLLRVGAGNKIFGTATADRMFFGTGSQVDVCEFNTSTGGDPVAACGNIPPDPNPPGAGPFPLNAWPPQAVPVSFPVSASNQVCPAGGALALAPGNYGELDVKDNCVLTLGAGDYNFKKVRLQNGSTTDGAGSTATFVNSNGSITTEPGVTINGVKMTTVNSGTFEAIVIGNASTLNDVVLYAPNARMHLHQGGVYSGFEGVAVFITVEPVIITPPPPQGCACVGEIEKSGTTIKLSNGCGLNNTNNTYFVDTVCEACPGGAGCNAATVAPGATPTSATLNIPAGLPAGDYHVIINSPAGSFCTSATLALP